MEIVEPALGDVSIPCEIVGIICGCVHVAVPVVRVGARAAGIRRALGQIVIPRDGHFQFAAAVFGEVGADAKAIEVFGESHEHVVIDE